MNYKAVITTAGIGSRLDDITIYQNKSMVRVGKKASVNYFIDQIPAEITIVVILGYLGNSVRNFLEICYPRRKFEFVYVENYNDVGSSMGYSLLTARKLLSCPFILSTCDTVIDSRIPQPDHNWLGVNSSKDNSQYTSLISNDDKIIKILEKGAKNSDCIYIGLAGIYDHDLFWNSLQEAYVADPLSSNLNDCSAFKKMLGLDTQFTKHVFNDWLDIGNTTALNFARENIADKFDNLEKLDESIYFVDGNVIKFFHDKNVAEKRVKRAALLSPCTPEIFSHKENFYKYPFVEGSILTDVVNKELLIEFLSWCRRNLWVPFNLSQSSRSEFIETCKNFYKNKTIDRIKKFYELVPKFNRNIIINDQEIGPVEEYLKVLDWDNLSNGISTRIHGDLHFENVIFNKDSGDFKLIDWRQDFGGILEYGDTYYDLAKLKHGMIVSHDIVRRNLFRVENDAGKWKCDILRPDTLVNCERQFERTCLDFGYDISKISILTALIYLNISALHHYPYNIFLHLFGRIKLAEAMDK